jgi:hypothetical protein
MVVTPYLSGPMSAVAMAPCGPTVRPKGPGPVSISVPRGLSSLPPGRIDPPAVTTAYRCPPGERKSAAEANSTAKAAAAIPVTRKMCNLYILKSVFMIYVFIGMCDFSPLLTIPKWKRTCLTTRVPSREGNKLHRATIAAGNFCTIIKGNAWE